MEIAGIAKQERNMRKRGNEDEMKMSVTGQLKVILERDVKDEKKKHNTQPKKYVKKM